MSYFFSLQITTQVHEPHSVQFFKNFRFLVIYSLKCLFAFLFQYQSDAFIIFFHFSSHSFHTNLNLVHVSVLVSSSHSSSIVLSLFHTNLNLVHVLLLVSSFRSSSIVLTVHFFLGLRLYFKHNID